MPYEAEEGALDRWVQFRRFYDYLVTSCGAHIIPGRQHLDPVDLGDILTRINLVDLVPGTDGPRLRYRLVGGDQAYYFAGGTDVTGRYLDEFWKNNPGLRRKILGDYERALVRKGPTIGIYNNPNREFSYLGYERMVFPLARDGRHIDMFAVLHAYRDSQTRQLG